MSLQVYINGQYFDKEKATISVFDHGLLYGDGVFEGMRSYGGKVFRLEEHLERLWDSAKSIWLEIPISQRGDGPSGQRHAGLEQDPGWLHPPDRHARPGNAGPGRRSLLEPASDHHHRPRGALSRGALPEGLEIVTASTLRNHPAAINPRIKSLNYLNNILAKIEGMQAGCVEALMLNHKGEVAECTGDNIFLVRRGQLLTPPTDAGILEGITRAAVMELAGEAGLTVREIALTRHDVYVADECFLTGSGAELIPVVKVDDRVIGNGKPGTGHADSAADGSGKLAVYDQYVVRASIACGSRRD